VEPLEKLEAHILTTRHHVPPHLPWNDCKPQIGR
jgi:hypothetical protein